MPVTADSVVVELEARTDAYRQQVTRAATDFERDMAKITAAGRRAELQTTTGFNALARATGNLRTTTVGATAALEGEAAALATVEAAEAGAAAGAVVAAGAMTLVAAAIAVVGGALLAARSSAQFAEDLQNAANAAHVSTDYLQEFAFALRNAGGDGDRAGDALNHFSTTLGQAKEGLRGAVQAFHALGFSPEEVRSWTTVQEALEHVVPRINELRDNPQRDAIIQQLGLRDAAPLIASVGDRGAQGMRDILEGAHAAGEVIDRDLIQRGAEANNQIEHLAHRVGVDLQEAFTGLQPPLIALLATLDAVYRTVSRIVDRLRDVHSRSGATLDIQATAIQAQIDANNASPNVFNQLDPRNSNANPTLQRRLNDINAERVRRLAQHGIEDINESVAAANASGTRDLEAPPSHTRNPRARHGPNVALQDLRAEDRTLQAIYDAQRRQAQAEVGLLAPLETQQHLQTEIVTAQRAHRDAEVAQQVAAYTASHHAQGISAAQGRRVTAANALADAAEDQLAAERNTAALAARDLEYDRRYFASSTSILSQQVNLARTLIERTQIQQRILQAERAQEIEEARARHQSDPLYQGEAGQALAAREDTDSAEAFQLRLRNNVEPVVDQFREGILGAFEALRTGGAAGVLEYLADKFKARLLDGLADQLARLLAQSALGGGKGGDGGIGSIIAQGASYLFGGKRAAGGPVVAGASYLVGEHGPEILTAGVSGLITPHGALQSGGVTHQHITFDNRGSVLTDELFARQQAIVNAAGAKHRMYTDRRVGEVAKAAPGLVGKFQKDRGR